MPRLTNQRYLARHHDLKQVWQKAPQLFEVLTSNDQWEVHDYFQPTRDLSDPDLLKHRQKISKRYPSLPNRAGKSYLFMVRCYVVAYQLSKGKRPHFDRVLTQLSRQPKVMMETNGRAGTIEITAKFRSEPDYGRLARALLMFLEEQKAAGKVADDDSIERH